MNPPSGSTSAVIMGMISPWLTLRKRGSGKRITLAVKLIAQPAQHALAQPPFERVYAELEDPVDHHQRQEKP